MKTIKLPSVTKLFGTLKIKIGAMILAIVLGMVLLGSCATPSTPAPSIETPPLSPPETSLPATVTNDSDQETTPLPTQPTEPPQQNGETDMVRDVLGLKYIADDYSVECISPSAFGLPGQLALIPDGNIVINDNTFRRLLLLSDNKLAILVDRDDLWGNAVAALPDGRICYVLADGQLVLFDYKSGITDNFGSTPPGDITLALAADKAGNVYAATRQNNLYHFNSDGDRITLATNLPFKQVHQITDMDIANDGTVYIAGHNRFISVSPDGETTVIADDLQNEPTWCEISPSGDIYIKDQALFSGIRLFNPATGTLTPIQIDFNAGVSDLLALSNDELLLFYMGSNIIYRYNLTTNEAVPVIINTINDRAFAVGSENIVFMATPSLESNKMGSVLKSYIVSINADGNRQDLIELSFNRIEAADVDQKNRLCLYADGSCHRIEADGSITSYSLQFPSGERIAGMTNFAVGPDDKWYFISSVRDGSIRVWCVDDSGEVVFLPITINSATFGDVYFLGDARIDVDDNGHLWFIVSAIGTKGQGPSYQKVYMAEADGTNVTMIADFESVLLGGFVDIAAGSRGDVFVYMLSPTSPGTVIYRINTDSEISRVVEIEGGRDPKSIDIDTNGNVWFCTTVGVFKATPD